MSTKLRKIAKERYQVLWAKIAVFEITRNVKKYKLQHNMTKFLLKALKRLKLKEREKMLKFLMFRHSKSGKSR